MKMDAGALDAVVQTNRHVVDDAHPHGFGAGPSLFQIIHLQNQHVACWAALLVQELLGGRLGPFRLQDS